MDKECYDGRTHGAGRLVGGIFAGIFTAGLIALIIGALVMVLWNWLMPALFGLNTIMYWQGFGIALLARLLFGGAWHRVPGEDRRRKAKYKYKGQMSHRRNGWFDDVYEQWWEAEGAKSFDAYIQREEGKEEKE